MASDWLADVSNDPRRDFDLCIEISRLDEHWGTLARSESGELVLTVYQSDKPVEIPAKWLAKILMAAEKDLPGGE